MCETKDYAMNRLLPHTFTTPDTGYFKKGEKILATNTSGILHAKYIIKYIW